MRIKQRILGLGLALSLVVSLCAPARAACAEAEESYARAAAFTVKTLPEPQVSSMGGEWAVLGLCRGGAAVPKGYYDGYYARAEEYVRERGGVLHARKYTEYSRVILAVTALGWDARNVAGYDLTLPLGDYDKSVWQGLNGPIWALIALDSGNYSMPENPEAVTQATRQMYVDLILSRQLENGAWSLSGNGDADLTAMALTALARYRQRDDVRAAADRAVDWLSAQQNGDGGFSTGGTATAESCAQVLIALCGLDIPLDDARFVKNGHTVLEALLTYQRADGSFAHVKDGGGNQMATEQALCALAAVLRAKKGQSGLYHMESTGAVSAAAAQTAGTAAAAAAAVVLMPWAPALAALRGRMF